MKQELFKQRRDELTFERFSLCDEKSKEYTIDSEDRHANFKRVGSNLGLPPEEVLMVYASKHFDSICRFVKNGCKEQGTEGIQGRISDLQNYLDLLGTLLEEKEHE
jgi:hypothetical protein